VSQSKVYEPYLNTAEHIGRLDRANWELEDVVREMAQSDRETGNDELTAAGERKHFVSVLLRTTSSSNNSCNN
jgi:hypothetical protein